MLFWGGAFALEALPGPLGIPPVLVMLALQGALLGGLTGELCGAVVQTAPPRSRRPYGYAVAASTLLGLLSPLLLPLLPFGLWLLPPKMLLEGRSLSEALRAVVDLYRARPLLLLGVGVLLSGASVLPPALLVGLFRAVAADSATRPDVMGGEFLVLFFGVPGVLVVILSVWAATIGGTYRLLHPPRRGSVP